MRRQTHHQTRLRIPPNPMQACMMHIAPNEGNVQDRIGNVHSRQKAVEQPVAGPQFEAVDQRDGLANRRVQWRRGLLRILQKRFQIQVRIKSPAEHMPREHRFDGDGAEIRTKLQVWRWRSVSQRKLLLHGRRRRRLRPARLDGFLADQLLQLLQAFQNGQTGGIEPVRRSAASPAHHHRAWQNVRRQIRRRGDALGTDFLTERARRLLVVAFGPARTTHLAGLVGAFARIGGRAPGRRTPARGLRILLAGTTHLARAVRARHGGSSSSRQRSRIVRREVGLSMKQGVVHQNSTQRQQRGNLKGRHQDRDENGPRSVGRDASMTAKIYPGWVAVGRRKSGEDHPR